MTDHEFGQKVMAAAGCLGDDHCECGHSRTDHEGFCMKYPCKCENYQLAHAMYPDPVTSEEGSAALLDALVAKGWLVIVQASAAGVCAEIKNKITPSCRAKGDNRKLALVEAAGRALGVTRD